MALSQQLVEAGHLGAAAAVDRATSEPSAQTVLSLLFGLRRPPADLPDYYSRLLRSNDEYLRVGAMAALLELEVLPRSRWPDAVPASKYGAVALRAFKFFTEALEHDMAQQVVDAFENSNVPSIAKGMRASLQMDARALAALEGQKFLNDGKIEHLIAAGDHAESAAGWREAVIWSARATALHPIVPVTALQLLEFLENANQFEIIKQVLDVFAHGHVFPLINTIYKSVLALHEKKSSDALSILARLRLDDIPNDSVRAKVCRIRAQAYEQLHNYNEAYNWYQRQNSQTNARGIDKRRFLAGIARLSQLDYPVLPEDEHGPYFMMVGFPRSGTTLLENALAAHPEVETFEEIPSMASVTGFIEYIIQDRISGEDERQAAFEKARARYYVEIDRRKSKPNAHVFVDKMPIRSAQIEIIEKLFPKKKYIFSIRHPFDVVLSCFKQSFKPNVAMENFRTIEDACNLYDRVMSTWFGVFPEETERVLYIRYDDLVTDFQAEMTRTLAFLGVDWSDDVNRFSELSEARQVKTPSYAKVRSGLSIGLQSSWQNYRFLFDTQHGRKLHKWIDRFGYSR